jgi:predicted metal-binding membrane protein
MTRKGCTEALANGTYFETCSCEFMCPCNASLSHGATYDRCRVTLVFNITEGEVEGTAISGLKVAAIADTPKVMTEGNWRLGVFIDDKARWVASGILLAAALYELTPLKDLCLAKCRSPLGFLLGSWRGELSGALQMGTKHGAWCVGCYWALMAALFALGAMSIAWMAFVAALIAAEKTLPWGRAVTYGTAAILLLLGVLLVAAPDAIPGLTIPGGGSMN